MKIYSAAFRREFCEPFRYGERSLESREGIYFRLETEKGCVYSEASPLPGHSRESLAEVEAALKNLSAGALIAQAFGQEKNSVPPSLAFAMEGLAAQTLAHEGSNLPVFTCALVPWLGLEKTQAAIFRHKNVGFGVVKLKVSNANATELLELIRSFRGQDIMFRLDGNRALNESTLTAFMAGLSENGSDLVDYFEEPFLHWRHPSLENSPVPLAADECAADPRFWRALLKHERGPSVFALKPSVSGGLFSLAEKATELEAAGKRIVYGSAMETEPGRRSILAFLSLEKTAVAGVCTGFLFRENFLPDLPVFTGPLPIEAAEKSFFSGLPWREIR